MKLISKKWKELEQLFTEGSRYIWEPLPKGLSVDEWLGAIDPVDGKRKMGLNEKAYDVLSSAMKAAFIAGHEYGARAAIDVVNTIHNEFDFDPEQDAAQAARTWDKVKEDL